MQTDRSAVCAEIRCGEVSSGRGGISDRSRMGQDDGSGTSSAHASINRLALWTELLADIAIVVGPAAVVYLLISIVGLTIRWYKRHCNGPPYSNDGRKKDDTAESTWAFLPIVFGGRQRGQRTKALHMTTWLATAHYRSIEQTLEKLDLVQCLLCIFDPTNHVISGELSCSLPRSSFQPRQC
jgi:hypothetical protein